AQGPGEKEPRTLFLPEALGLLKEAERLPRLTPSEGFHKAYEKLRERLEKERVSTTPGSNTLESRALNNIRTALKNYGSELEEAEQRLLRVLEQDILYDRQLPRYQIRCLQQVSLEGPERLAEFRKVPAELQEQFGRLRLPPTGWWGWRCG
ncbi:MAG: helicase, partial [Thermus sp.]|nr:helicase [Thermus sp.]